MKEGYIFVTEQVTSIAPIVSTDITVRSNEVTVEIQASVELDDVIHLRYRDGNILKGVYGIVSFIDFDAQVPYFVFTFDKNIYQLSEDIIPSDFLGADVYRGNTYDKISKYDIKSSVVRATYSEEQKSYYTSFNYELSINEEKRAFFNSFKPVLAASKILFADYCDGFAYGVSLTEDSYDNIGNVFKKSINFNIAKR